MRLRPDVGHLHAVLSLGCGALAVLFGLLRLVDKTLINSDEIVLSSLGLLFAGFWCGLFAIILRGTLVSRGMASLGLAASGFALFFMLCAL